ncbi:MAG: ribose 5-phosphate isomerase B [Clostridiales bacterium]|nr:ribose 5-phosphate isomerase B [Clostridiales bacterium]
MLALAADHGGYELKEAIKKHLDSLGLSYIDLGTDSEKSVNYPEYAAKLCHEIQSGKCYRGILCCGTGIGMSMAANKHKGIRAACASDAFSVRYTRLHNDANVFCLGGRVVGVGLALELVDIFIGTEFEGGRHTARLDMIKNIEDNQ